MSEALDELVPESLTVKAAGEGRRSAPEAPGPTAPIFEMPDEETYNRLREQSTPRTPEGMTERAASIIAEAKKFVGTPYVWGGSSPNGFDCSGFTQYVYRKFGIELPRVSYQQANGGTRISLDDLQPGDLVAWDNSSRNNGADHIGIYLGDGKVIHAPKPGDSVKISQMWDHANAWGVRY